MPRVEFTRLPRCQYCKAPAQFERRTFHDAGSESPAGTAAKTPKLFVSEYVCLTHKRKPAVDVLKVLSNLSNQVEDYGRSVQSIYQKP